jgi:hypothetical protein
MGVPLLTLHPVEVKNAHLTSLANFPTRQTNDQRVISAAVKRIQATTRALTLQGFSDLRLEISDLKRTERYSLRFKVLITYGSKNTCNHRAHGDSRIGAA